MDERYIKTSYPRTTLRTHPEPTAEALAVVPEGSDVEILERGQKYCKVTAWHAEQGYVTGYVANKFIYGSQASTEKKNPHTRSLTCEVCGSPTTEYLPAARGGYLYLYAGFLTQYQLKARVCIECGNVKFCVDGEDLQALQEKHR